MYISAPGITYEDIVAQKDSLLVVDVRNRSELAEKGKIPQAHNIPCE